MRGKPWNEKRIGLLRQLWAEGESASAIAARLGVSRQAVLGKVFRLRLGPPQARPGDDAAAPSRRPSGRQGRGRTLFELTNDSCRWPIGRPGTPHFHFCGEDGADLQNGLPYCDEHMRRAFVHHGKSAVAAAPVQLPSRAGKAKSPSIVPAAKQPSSSKTLRRRA